MCGSLEGLEQHEKGQNAPASPFDAFFGGGGNRGVNRGPDAKVEMQVGTVAHAHATTPHHKKQTT
jgi:hypothetical protein